MHLAAGFAAAAEILGAIRAWAAFGVSKLRAASQFGRLRPETFESHLASIRRNIRCVKHCRTATVRERPDDVKQAAPQRSRYGFDHLHQLGISIRNRESSPDTTSPDCSRRPLPSR